MNIIARRCAALLAGLTLAWVLPVRAQVLGANDQPIHDAARLGSGAQVQTILKATPAARDARTALGSTPLHLAATNPDSSSIKTHAGRDPMSMARKNMANEVAGVISLWVLKGCKAGKPC